MYEILPLKEKKKLYIYKVAMILHRLADRKTKHGLPQII